MSRTKHRYLRMHTCTGSNTEFYRERRRGWRAKNRNILRTLMANKSVEDLNDNIYNYEIPKCDRWEEPTDGSYPINRAKREDWNSEFYTDRWFNVHIKSKLKRP